MKNVYLITYYDNYDNKVIYGIYTTKKQAQEEEQRVIKESGKKWVLSHCFQWEKIETNKEIK